MFKAIKNHFTAIFIAVITMGVTSGSALAGGLLAIDFDPGNFSSPTLINNPYWPLLPR